MKKSDIKKELQSFKNNEETHLLAVTRGFSLNRLIVTSQNCTPENTAIGVNYAIQQLLDHGKQYQKVSMTGTFTGTGSRFTDNYILIDKKLYFICVNHDKYKDLFKKELVKTIVKKYYTYLK